MSLSPEKIEKLEYAFRHGVRISHAREAAGVSWPTIKRYFERFKADGIPRGEIKGGYRRLQPQRMSRPRPLLAVGRRKQVDVEVYTGPAVIGRAITKPQAPVGPGWIGKPTLRAV